MLEVTPPTAHTAIDSLVDRGDLREVTGKDRNLIYEAPQYSKPYSILPLDSINHSLLNKRSSKVNEASLY